MTSSQGAIRTSDKQDRINKILVKVGIVLALGLSSVFVAFFIYLLSDPLTKTYRGEAAAAEYRENVADTIRLPSEAKILSVQSGIGEHTIRFTLPGNRPPEEWVKRMWAGNKFAAHARITDIWYSAYHTDKPNEKDGSDDRFSKLHHGWRLIRYLPEEQEYLAETNID